MSGTLPGLLIDTDILIDHFRGFRAFVVPKRRVAYSVVTRCELFARRSSDEDGIKAVLEAMTEILVDRRIAESAGRLRRSTHMRTPDALIAATALANDLSLMTRNIRDFSAVDGLDIVEPSQSSVLTGH
jgi:predicted nucleic acid-binding protein